MNDGMEKWIEYYEELSERSFRCGKEIRKRVSEVNRNLLWVTINHRKQDELVRIVLGVNFYRRSNRREEYEQEIPF